MSKCSVCGKDISNGCVYYCDMYCHECYHNEFDGSVKEFNTKLDGLGERMESLLKELKQLHDEFEELENPELNEDIQTCEKAIARIKSGLALFY